MSYADGADTIGLTVLRQDGCLAVSLTDFRLVAKLARSEDLPEPVLQDLRQETLRWLAGTSPWDERDMRHVAGRHLCAFGARLFESFLPVSIRSFLRNTAPHSMSLQLDSEVAWVPWELAFDGDAFLGEKFGVGRQIVGETPLKLCHPAPKSGTFKVLVLAGGRNRSERVPAVQSVIGQLRIMVDVEVSTADAAVMRKEDLLALIGSSDIVHYIGEVAAGSGPAGNVHWWSEDDLPDVASIASLPAPPQLLISQNTALPATAAHTSVHQVLATQACRRGLNILTCETPHEGSDALEFLLCVYRQLVQGIALGESVREARAKVHRDSGMARVAKLRAELYGDCRLITFASDRRTRSDDTLRQVTILSFDLVESTRVLAGLGAERYSEMLAEYHRRCAQILGSYGGTPEDPQGDDGTMCYFGFPVAREDAATQALRASFAMIDAVSALGLSVRVGACTGQVVVRDGVLVGSAIHFAARLQSIAAPGTMVVGDSTRRLIKEGFRFEPLDRVAPLKGFDQPETLYSAIRVSGPESPPATDPVVAVARVTPFVGRKREMQLLEEHWAATRAGALQLVRVVGDAGIGKSRLVREFKRSLIDTGHEVFECRCAPEHANSAFHPLIESLRSELRISGGEDEETAIAQLRRLASRTASIGDDGTALLADLLAIAAPPRHPALAFSAERRRQLTLDLLVSLAKQLVREAAACMIVEDVHWADPSTREFLDRLANEARTLPLLILVTARSDGDTVWHPRFVVHEAELRGLSPEFSRTLVQGTCGEARLPSEVVHLIATRADGVPLFIEESTRMAVDLSAAGADVLSTSVLSVPTTILDLLTARLDRLHGAKQIAQVAGTIGREFPLALLEAVMVHPGSPFAARDVPARLATLVRSGMLIVRTEGDETRYAFKHALMRDAAYRSLLGRDRTRLHRLIASVIAEQFRSIADRQPELLAFHYSEAGIDGDALRCWEIAARQAASRSAHLECISHVHSALAALKRGAPDTARDRAELRLHLLLATRLIATEGYGAERVERVYARAMELATALSDAASMMKVLLGLEGYHFMRADFPKAQAYALKAGALAPRNPIHVVQTKWAEANILMHQGEMAPAVRLMDDCRAEYDRLAHRPDAVQDPGVMCLCYSAWSLWQLGYPDEALRRVVAVVARADQLKHKFSIGEAYGFLAAVQHFRGEDTAALESAERAICVCEESGFAVWLAHARVMHGRIVAELGDASAGIEEMRQGYELWADTGAVVTTPFYLAMRAEGLALGGRHSEGLALLEQALAIVERNGERYYEAEIRRLVGELMLQEAAHAGRNRSAEAESWLHEALACAQSRQMRSLALRCAISLADLLALQGRRTLAVEVLGPAYAAIDEGAQTRDLVRARERLRGMT